MDESRIEPAVRLACHLLLGIVEIALDGFDKEAYVATEQPAKDVKKARGFLARRFTFYRLPAVPAPEKTKGLVEGMDEKSWEAECPKAVGQVRPRPGQPNDCGNQDEG